MSTNTQNTVSKSELFGRVKWFNHRLGYGFITTIYSANEPGDTIPQDIFVHHNAIRSEEESYKYLVQGEYVQFNLVETVNSTYAVQADDVRGIYSGKLMCDVHNEQKKHTSTLNTSRSYHNSGKNNYKRESRESGDSYDRPRDRDYDQDREPRQQPQEPYSRSRYTYSTPRSSSNTLTEPPRVHPEYKYDETKTPRSVRRHH
jgi:cold shock CspA family protein